MELSDAVAARRSVRAFLDVLGSSMRPALAGVISDYEKTVRQRNALLKSARKAGRFTQAHEATLSAWNDQLATYGAAALFAGVPACLAAWVVAKFEDRVIFAL